MNPSPKSDSPAMSPDAEASLWRAFARGLRDNMLAEFGVQVLRLVELVVLARALQPADFGIFRVLLVISMFAMLANEAGIPDALIQRKELRPEHESTAWWLSVAAASISACLLYSLAPYAARLMAMPSLGPATRLLCLPILLEGTASVANARLRRRLDFATLAKAEVFSEASFLVSALLLLHFGFGQWCLAGGLAAKFTIHALFLWTFAGYLPRSLPRIAAARDLARFSFGVLGGSIINLASANADYLMVGRLLGSTALGFYVMAWSLLRFIPDRLHRIAVRVSLPTFCKLQDDNEKLAHAYRDFINYTCRIVLPIVACAFVAAPELLGALYGPQWVPAGVPLRLLALGLGLAGVRIAIGAVYYAKGHPEIDIYLHSSRLILILAVVSITAPAGLFGVSAGMSVVEGMISIAGQLVVCRLVGLNVRQLVAAGVPGLKTAMLCGLVSFAGKVIAQGAELHGLEALPLIAAPPAVLFAWLEVGPVREAYMNLRPSTAMAVKAVKSQEGC